MMRILLCHDYYRSSAPSGEDTVFRNERTLLEEQGVDVVPFERFNDDIDDSTLSKRLSLAFSSTWSRKTYSDITKIIRKSRPDLAHFHNTFPLISPSAYAACQDNGVPVVQTLHNYRLICPGPLLQRDGKPCEDCVGTNLLPSLINRCYRGSLLATGSLVWMISYNRWRNTYKTLVNRYIALTHFAAGRLIAGGLPEDKIEVKPNSMPNPPEIGRGGGGYAVFVGRLRQEKGLQTLLSAWKTIDNLPLKILGDGELRPGLEDQVREKRLPVEFLGYKRHEETLDILRKAELQIIPSESYEGFPLVVLEAYAAGAPVIASRIGSLAEIVLDEETGLLFDPGNPKDLAQKVNRLRFDRELSSNLRREARKAFEMKYTPKRNFEMLMNIYQQAMDDFEKTKVSSYQNTIRQRCLQG